MKAQKVISLYDTVKELESFGIEYLTSESCGYSMRALFDINKTAQNYISQFFGGIEFLANGWNSQDKKSILLPREILSELLIFCYLESGYVVLKVQSNDDFRNPHLRLYDSWDDMNYEIEHFKIKDYRIYSGKNRNTHAFSGRTY